MTKRPLRAVRFTIPALSALCFAGCGSTTKLQIDHPLPTRAISRSEAPYPVRAIAEACLAASLRDSNIFSHIVVVDDLHPAKNVPLEPGDVLITLQSAAEGIHYVHSWLPSGDDFPVPYLIPFTPVGIVMILISPIYVSSDHTFEARLRIRDAETREEIATFPSRGKCLYSRQGFAAGHSHNTAWATPELIAGLMHDFLSDTRTMDILDRRGTWRNEAARRKVTDSNLHAMKERLLRASTSGDIKMAASELTAQWQYVERHEEHMGSAWAEKARRDAHVDMARLAARKGDAAEAHEHLNALRDYGVSSEELSELLQEPVFNSVRSTPPVDTLVKQREDKGSAPNDRPITLKFWTEDVETQRRLRAEAEQRLLRAETEEEMKRLQKANEEGARAKMRRRSAPCTSCGGPHPYEQADGSCCRNVR